MPHAAFLMMIEGRPNSDETSEMRAVQANGFPSETLEVLGFGGGVMSDSCCRFVSVSSF